jgi:predicted Holliday junction resolvase-like endonuclease
MRQLLLLATVFALTGCVTSVVKEVVMAPVKIVSKTADVLTTSQSEADEKRGRDMRKKEERLGKLARERDKLREKCEDGSKDACEKLRDVEDELEAERDSVS